MDNRSALSSLVLIAGVLGCEAKPRSEPPTATTASVTATPTNKAKNGEYQLMNGDNASSVLDFTVKDIDGNEVPLKRYRGKVLLIVNVASKCGLTPQYEGLQELHEQYADRGLAILGFPANDFLRQEPGTDARIKEFCSTKYGVGFDMFAKVSVKGRDKCELYGFLTSKQSNPGFGGELKWNFTKFLVDREGRVIGRFEPRVRPGDSEVVGAIETALRTGE